MLYRLTVFIKLTTPLLLIIALVLLGACRNQAKSTPLPLLTQGTPISLPTARLTPVISKQTPLLPYTHPSGRFSLSYPQGWQPFERPDGVIFIEPHNQAGYSVIFTEVEKAYSPQELNQYLVTFVGQNFAGEGSNFKAIRQEQGADGAVVAQFSSTDPHLGQATSQVTIAQKGTIIFVLHLSAPEAQWDISAGSLQKLLESFKVLNVQPSAATTPAPTGEAPVWTLIGPKSNEFGFLYASDWQVLTQEDNLVEVAQLENKMTFTATNFIWTGASQGPKAAIEAAKTQLATLSKEYKDVKSLPPTEFPLNQVKGATIDFLYVAEDGTQMAGSIITGLANGKMHQLVFTAPAEYYEAALQWFNPMYKSFKMLSPEKLKENP